MKMSHSPAKAKAKQPPEGVHHGSHHHHHQQHNNIKPATVERAQARVREHCKKSKGKGVTVL